MSAIPFRWTQDQQAALELLAGPAQHVMLLGGSRSGKTFVLCAAIVFRALKSAGSRHVIFKHHFNHVKTSIGLDTLPKVLALRFPGVAVKLDKSDWFFEFPNGSQIWLAGLDDKDRTEKILGTEYSTLYFNECSQIAYRSVLIALTRLAQRSGLRLKAYYDCNPPGTKHWTALQFLGKKNPSSSPVGAPLPNPDAYVWARMNPEGNRENIAEGYIEGVLGVLPDRQRRRFLLGEFTSELDNALWTVDSFSAAPSAAPTRRIVVAVDPSGASGKEDERSDEIGIVAAAIHTDERYTVLDDRTMRGSPQQWARAAINLLREVEGDRMVAEINYGGAMVAAVINAEDRSIHVKTVRASRGKVVRAEPISALYARGLVAHAKSMPELEDQLVNMTTAGYMGERSPDRADALVWALSELSGNVIRAPSVMTI